MEGVNEQREGGSEGAQGSHSHDDRAGLDIYLNGEELQFTQGIVKQWWLERHQTVFEKEFLNERLLWKSGEGQEGRVLPQELSLG